MREKQCSRCERTLEISAFPRHRKSRDGHASICKRCDNERERQSRLSDPRRYLLKHARERAKSHGIPYALTAADIVIPNFCPVLGIPLTVGEGRPHDGSPTVDRFIPELGYVRGNVTVISMFANRIKNNATPEQILLLAEWIKKQTT